MWHWIIAIMVIVLLAALVFRYFLIEVIEEDNLFLVLSVIFIVVFIFAASALVRIIPKPGRADVASFGKAFHQITAPKVK